jgi:SAM-dependent methyltransferase
LGVGSCLLALLGCLTAADRPFPAATPGSRTLTISWQDLGPLQPALRARGIEGGGFRAYVERTREENARRVREGDVDHLVFYLLQSRSFTTLPPIEPALSARGLVEGLPPAERAAFLDTGRLAGAHVPEPVRVRIAAFLQAAGLRGADPAGPLLGTGPSGDGDARLEYFRELVTTTFPDADAREAALLDEYLRVMHFLYQQEFAARRTDDAAGVVRELYQRRGFSTDTAVEAGFLVYSGLGIIKALEPERRIRRVLVVGPGMDLAPRTGLVEQAQPESYQPWTVIDALLALDLARADALEVVAADINPRVVAHIDRTRTAPPSLQLWTGAFGAGVGLSDDYREYFQALGNRISVRGEGSGAATSTGQLGKKVRVRPEIARLVRAERLDVVTERLDEPPFDLVIATNILPYFDDTELMLAMTNIARMLAPGGVFLHNEGRPILGEIGEALGMPFEQSRHATIAHVKGAPPLGDSVWLHRRER